MAPPQTPGQQVSLSPNVLQQNLPQQNLLQKSVLVFSQNYLPTARVSLKRAAVLLLSGQAESLSFDRAKSWQLRSPSQVLTVPEHIRLRYSRSDQHWKVPAVNRRGVLKRDNHTCQYCGSHQDLTLDHVVPRSKGGPHTWQNVVTACARCNGKKGDRTPAQAGLTLRTQPKAPVHPALRYLTLLDCWDSP
ncbi:MAG: HNH endonuclease [Prochlorothrix sp.]|nr:HNH endonuclease [Prochlorothrix sp.]